MPSDIVSCKMTLNLELNAEFNTAGQASSGTHQTDPTRPGFSQRWSDFLVIQARSTSFEVACFIVEIMKLSTFPWSCLGTPVLEVPLHGQ